MGGSEECEGRYTATFGCEGTDIEYGLGRKGSEAV
nr:MAG TPA: hypothetical protein [Caudoviricetes sp.]